MAAARDVAGAFKIGYKRWAARREDVLRFLRQPETIAVGTRAVVVTAPAQAKWDQAKAWSHFRRTGVSPG